MTNQYIVFENIIQQSETTWDESQPIPYQTEWEESLKCCCLKFQTVTPKKRCFCRSIEFNPSMGIVVVILSLIPLISFFLSTVLFYSSIFGIFLSSFFVIFFYFLFLWSYFSASCMDPGFLPFDWIRTKKMQYSYQEQLSGLAYRDDQFEFAEKNKPSFASFSTTSGRFVIRGDHICGWINNWVGKRNHKQFVLFMLWGSCFSFWCLATKLIKIHVFSSQSQSLFLLTSISTAVELCFGILLLMVFFGNMTDIWQNQTKISVFKNLPESKVRGFDAMKEVFGSGHVLGWMCPCPAFDENLLDMQTICLSSQS